MKKGFTLLFFAALISTSLFANSKGLISLQNGNLHVTRNISQFLEDAPNMSVGQFNGYYHLLIRFDAIPTQAEREAFEATGISLIEYVPKNAYIARVPAAYDLAQMSAHKVSFAGPVPKELTMHPDLYSGVYPAHAMVGTNRIRLQVMPFRGQDSEMVKEALLEHDVVVFKDPNYPDKISIEADLQQIADLAVAPFTFYLAPIDVEPYLENYTSRTSHRANTIDNYLPGGDRYDGTGINVGLQDDGFIGPHIDYQGRLVQFTATNGGNHGDHVAGTIMGAGNLNPKHKGMAPGVTIKVGYYFQIHSSMATYYANDTIYITSASLGATCNGGYDANAVSRDQQINSMPHLMHVFSAGNSQSSNCGYGAGTGWGTITGGHKQAKNLIAVSALDHNDNMSGYSSWGPAADGRLKPEVAARGSAVISTGTGNNYYTASGTSMACPGTSGSLAQLYHAYRELNGQAYPPSEITKAALLNGADDLGVAGPDYKFGYGRVNNRRSLEILENNWYSTGSISQGGSNTFNITVPANTAQLKVLVYWHDYEGTPGATKALVNDLDITLQNPSLFTYQPLVLDPTPNASNLNSPAVPGVDTLNNHEQIVVDVPATGTYTLTINGTAVPQGPQSYVIAWYFQPDEMTVTYPMGGEPFAPGDNEKIRWDAQGSAGTFTLEYSTYNGGSWNTIASGVSASQRYYDWTVPAVVTSQAKIRITRGVQVAMSDTFSIIGTPTGLSMSDKCASIGTLSWNAVSGADGYDVFALGNKYMDSIGYTTGTFFDVSGLSIGSSNWYSVRARTNAGAVGQRAVAIQHTHNGAGVCFPRDLAVTSLTTPAAGCGLTASETVTMEVRNQGSDSIPAGTSINIYYQLNGGGVVSESIVLPAQLNSGATTTIAFSTTGDFTSQLNTIDLWFDLTGDAYALNDTLFGTTLNNYPLVNTFPYLEDFEIDSGGWFSGGSANPWQWGTPAGPSINTNAPGGTKSWMTNLTGNYPDFSQSFVQGPCFDFSTLTNPWIRLDINHDIEFSWDGAILQASTNSGVSWTTVGAFGDPNNWYNDNSIFALAAIDPAEEGWTGNSSGWVSASHALTGLGGQSNVWIRIVFASDQTVTEDGIAFDNVEIYEPLSDDMAMQSIDAPISFACLSNAETVELTLINNGGLSQSNIPVAISVTGPISSGIINDTFTGTINSGVAGALSVSTTVDLSVTGAYTITAWTMLSGDQDNLNDTISVVVNSLSPINSFPWTEDFESFTLCGNSNVCNVNCDAAVANNWRQDQNDQQDWRVDNGTTASGNTGPPQDYDPGTSTGQYVYTEASGGCTNQTMNLISPCIDISGLSNPRFSFFYHMFGATTGTLNVDISTNNGATWATIWSLTGQQQNSTAQPWRGDTIDISAYTGTVRFRLQGITGGDFTSDMAVDAVAVFDQPGIDAGVVSVISPSSNTCLTNAEPLEVELQNSGLSSFSILPVVAHISGPISSGPIFDTLFATVNPGNTATLNMGGIDLSAVGAYSITVATLMGGDGNSANDTFTAIVNNQAAIGSFPWYEDFESFTVCGNSNVCNLDCSPATANGWQQDQGDQQDWRVDQGATASVNTGPSVDFDPGTPTGKYVYTEASGGCGNQTMNLITPCFNLDSLVNGRLSFFYHMFGGQTGTINVDISVNNGVSWTNIWTLTGQQQAAETDPWLGDTIDISAYSGTAKFRFQGITGNGFESDMALDAVQVFDFPLDDVSVTAINSPVSGACGNASATVDITVTNNSNISQSNIPVNFVVTGAASSGPVSEVMPGPLAPGASNTYTFVLPSNLSLQGSYTVIAWTSLVGDINNSNDTTTSSVTIQDNVNPSISCVGNINASTDPGNCTATVTYAAPSASDNCGVPVVSQIAGLASGSNFPIGVTTNTFVATDAAGNADTCSFTVTVTDNEAPSISCGSNISRSNDAGLCTATVSYSAPSANDNCPGVSVSQIAGLASGSAFPIGTTTNTFVATDAAGNADTCSFTVTVTDNEAPSISCGSTINRSNDAGLCTATVSYSAPSANDNCPGVSVSQIAGLASGSAFPIGTTTNTFVATDAAGNADTCSLDVVVADTSNPVISCTTNLVVTASPGTCTETVTFSTPSFTDNCPGGSVSQIAGLASGSSFPIGVTTNTFEATDAAGNTDQCSFTVTVISADTVIAGFNFSVSALGVTFTNTSQDATSYVWDFGDGNGSSSTNPSHNYASGGNYTVQLIAIGACESDTVTQLVSVAATSHIWTGLVDSSWGNPGNWSNNVVPSTSCTEIDVVIPSGTPNDPVVDGHYNINNLTVQAGARLTVNQNDTLELCGNFTHNGLPVTGLGLIKASSTVNPQTISGTFRIGILEIFNPQGVSLVGNSSVGVRIALNMMQGDLAIPPTSSLVLESRASGTAYLDDFTSLTAGSVTNGSGGNGEVTVERFVTNPVNAFHFISAAVSPASVSGWSDDFTIYGTNNAQVVPLPNCDPNNLAPGSPYGGLFEYREDAVNTCELEGWHVRSSGSLDQGEGYAGIISNGTRIELVGEPGTGNISFGPLTRTSTNTTAGQGWNMLGNPYPSALNWPDVAAANPALGATGYLWQSSGYYGGTLQPLSALIPSDNIASSQSFEVEVLGPAPQSVTVNFNNSMRRTGDPTFQRSVGNYDQRIDLVVEANGFADKTHVVFLNGPTNGWDGNYDGRKRASLAGQPTLFSYIGNEMMSINARPEFDQNGASVPVGLIAGANGSFDIRLDVLEGFPFGTLVLLEDKQLGIFHNLIDQQTYSFTGNVNDAHDRFVLHFTPPVEVSATAESCDGNDGELDVDLGQFGQGGWTFVWDSVVISGNGQHLVNMNVNGSLNTASLSPGAYSIEFHYNGFMIDTVIMVDDLSQVDAGFVADKVLLQVGEMITLTDASVGASTLQWSFGDGNQAGNQSVVTHSYATDGLYTIRQDASNQDCSADTSIQVEVLKNSTGIAVLDGVKFHITSEPGYLIVNIHGEVSENVGVTVHDLKGAHVIDEEIEGSERIPWDFAQGYYLVRLTYKSLSHSQQVLLR